jgi:glutamate racemase
MHQVSLQLPCEHVIYFGDTARLPYGDKSQETIIKYSMENTQFLLDQEIKALVIACNTATAYALERLQASFSIPIIGAIEPGARFAVNTSKNGRIAVLGTKGTINSGAYQKAILAINKEAFILPIACPLFVPLVEESFVKHPAARLIVEEYLKPIAEHEIDTIVLGCTHYPLLKQLIAEVVSEEINIIDTSIACAKEVELVLKQHQLLRQDGLRASYRYSVSDDPQKFKRLGSAFLGRAIDEVHLCI